MSAQPPLNSPLTEEHYKRITEGISRLQEAQGQIELAKRAGIDVAEQEKEITEARQKLIRIRNVYYPGR